MQGEGQGKGDDYEQAQLFAQRTSGSGHWTVTVFSRAGHSEYGHTMAFGWTPRSGGDAFRLQQPILGQAPSWPEMADQGARFLRARAGGPLRPGFPHVGIQNNFSLPLRRPPSTDSSSSGYRCEHSVLCGCCVKPGPPEIRGPRIAVAARLGLGVAFFYLKANFLRAWTPPHPGGDSSIAGVRRAPPAEQNAPNPVRVIIGDNEVHPGSDQLRT